MFAHVLLLLYDCRVTFCTDYKYGLGLEINISQRLTAAYIECISRSFEVNNQRLLWELISKFQNISGISLTNASFSSACEKMLPT